MEIVVIQPDGVPPLQPPLHHLTTSLTLLCHVEGDTNQLHYHWTTTAVSNFTHGSTSVFNRNTFLTAADAGRYTCTVSDGLGNTGQDSIDIRFTGEQNQLFKYVEGVSTYITLPTYIRTGLNLENWKF